MAEKIRVLHVVTQMNLGGIETFLMNVYRKINREKVQFDFLTHRLDEGYYDQEIESLGGRIFKMRPLGLKQMFSYRHNLRKFLLDHPEYSIIHSHLNENSALVLSAAKKVGVPIRIAHSHARATVNNYKMLREFFITRLPEFATDHFACSSDAGNWLFKNNSYMVVKNGIEVNRFKFDQFRRDEVRKRLQIQDGDIVIGNVARFNKVKNHQFLIKVFSELTRLNKKSKLLLVGDGGLKNNLLDQVNELGISDQVIFTGAVDNPEEYLNAMDVFVLPSIFEGLGIVLIEAQCNGLPVLFSDGIPKEAFVTDIAYQKALDISPEIWAKKLLEIYFLNKDNDRTELANKIHEKNFDIESVVADLEEFYLSEI